MAIGQQMKSFQRLLARDRRNDENHRHDGGDLLIRRSRPIKPNSFPDRILPVKFTAARRNRAISRELEPHAATIKVYGERLTPGRYARPNVNLAVSRPPFPQIRTRTPSIKLKSIPFRFISTV